MSVTQRDLAMFCDFVKRDVEKFERVRINNNGICHRGDIQRLIDRLKFTPFIMQSFADYTEVKK